MAYVFCTVAFLGCRMLSNGCNLFLHVQVYAVDKSDAAAAWANLNAQRLGLTDKIQVINALVPTVCAITNTASCKPALDHRFETLNDCSGLSSAVRQSQDAYNLPTISQCMQIKTGSWYEPVQDMRGQFAGIVSNPPYIPQSQMEHLQVSRPTVCNLRQSRLRCFLQRYLRVAFK